MVPFRGCALSLSVFVWTFKLVPNEYTLRLACGMLGHLPSRFNDRLLG
jgi:hypothetical protein